MAAPLLAALLTVAHGCGGDPREAASGGKPKCTSDASCVPGQVCAGECVWPAATAAPKKVVSKEEAEVVALEAQARALEAERVPPPPTLTPDLEACKPGDTRAALAACERACAGGQRVKKGPDACATAAGVHSAGRIVPQDVALARSLYAKGCDANEAGSCWAMASYHEQAKQKDLALAAYKKTCEIDESLCSGHRKYLLRKDMSQAQLDAWDACASSTCVQRLGAGCHESCRPARETEERRSERRSEMTRAHHRECLANCTGPGADACTARCALENRRDRAQDAIADLRSTLEESCLRDCENRLTYCVIDECAAQAMRVQPAIVEQPKVDKTPPKVDKPKLPGAQGGCNRSCPRGTPRDAQGCCVAR